MERPILEYAQKAGRINPNATVRELTPRDDILTSIAWMADNSEHGIDEAGKNTIDKVITYTAAMQAEIDRYRQGMENWKKTAEEKDGALAVLREVLSLGASCAVDITGDPEDGMEMERHGELAQALAAIKECLRLGQEAHNERNELRMRDARPVAWLHVTPRGALGQYSIHDGHQIDIVMTDKGPLPLTFARLHAVSYARALRWHPNGLEEWNIAEWTNAMAGEAGEACNAAKKLRRIECKMQQADGDSVAPKTLDEARRKVGKEVGDTVIYGDLVARQAGMTLEECVVLAFNSISEREGFPERL